MPRDNEATTNFIIVDRMAVLCYTSAMMLKLLMSNVQVYSCKMWLTDTFQIIIPKEFDKNASLPKD